MTLAARTALLAIGMLTLAGCAQGGDEEAAGAASALSASSNAEPSSFDALDSAAFDAVTGAFASGGDDCTFTAESADGMLELVIKKDDGSSAKLYALMTFPVTLEEHVDADGSFDKTFRVHSSSTLEIAHVSKSHDSVTITNATTALTCVRTY
jgi:hypothetical protein